MKPVIDAHGNVVNGLYRSDHGHLVTKDPDGYAKYIKSLSTVKEVETLKLELKELNDKVALLMQHLALNKPIDN